jgi:hypothetical protein
MVHCTLAQCTLLSAEGKGCLTTSEKHVFEKVCLVSMHCLFYVIDVCKLSLIGREFL